MDQFFQGRPLDDPRFATLKSRVEHIELVGAIVSDWTRTRTVDAIFQAAMQAKVPAAPVRTLDQVVNDPNMHARGALQWQDHPDYGRIVVQQSPFRFDAMPFVPNEPSRPLGADTADVLRDRLGWSDEKVAGVAG